eukprot:gene19951-21905_t
MSWLSGIAKGAEALLDKVDQTAASALQKDNSSNLLFTETPTEEAQNGGTSQESGNVQKNVDISHPQTAAKEADQISRPLSGSSAFSKGIAHYRSSSASIIKSKSDEQLFDFLNSASSMSDVSKRKSLPLTSTPIKSKQLANRTTAGVESKENVEEKALSTANDAEKSLEPSHEDVVDHAKNVTELDNQSLPASGDTEDGAVVRQSAVVPKIDSRKSEQKEVNDRISNLQLENKLLKSEISSLNEELAGALRSAKNYHTDTRHLEEKLEHAQSQMMRQDKMVKSIQENEKDLAEALKAKDSQLAVLRVRMEESDEELRNKNELISQLTSENERILKDHSDSTGLQSVALDTFKDKLEEREKELLQAKAEQDNAQEELMQLRSRLQNEQHQMAESVRSLQLKLNEEKGKTRELEHSLRLSKDATETAQKDLKEYKDKATRILQAKEKLITSLKQGTAGNDPSSVVFTEMEEIRHDRDLLREELSQSKYKYEQLKSDLFDIEQQNQVESEEQQQLIDNLEKSLEDEKQKREHCEDQLKRQSEEFRILKDDTQRHRLKSSVLIQERETEIQRLTQQIKLKSSTSNSQEELENRIRSLTDNLIQKQTLIETLSTEKSSLSLQLERLEQQYRDVQHNLSKSNLHSRNTHHIDFDESDEANQNSRSIASIMPLPVTRSHRWKNTVNVIDKFSHSHIQVAGEACRLAEKKKTACPSSFFLDVWIYDHPSLKEAQMKKKRRDEEHKQRWQNLKFPTSS